jgi:hypothetical protein
MSNSSSRFRADASTSAPAWASAVRSYQAADLVFYSHNAAAGITAGLSPHITVWASLLGSYSPPYQQNVFSGLSQAMIGQATVLPGR